jgi:hypothetical protein
VCGKILKRVKNTKKPLDRKVKYLFYLLVANFIAVLLQIFVPFIGGGMLFLLPFITFSLIGFVLIYSVKKAEIQGKLRKNLNLVGYSAGLIFASVFLHNIISAIGIFLGIKDFEEPVFFILATVVLPILFIFGVVKSILTFKQK